MVLVTLLLRKAAAGKTIAAMALRVPCVAGTKRFAQRKQILSRVAQRATGLSFLDTG